METPNNLLHSRLPSYARTSTPSCDALGREAVLVRRVMNGCSSCEIGLSAFPAAIYNASTVRFKGIY